MSPSKSQKRWVLGLTGGIGSGKSTVLQFFQKSGAVVFDSDAVVQKLLQDKNVLRRIKMHFGNDVVPTPRSLDKTRLARIVFQSNTNRRTLERLLHPLVRKELRNAILKLKQGVLVCDIPLLYEKKWEGDFDRVVVVDAPVSTRLDRLRKKGYSIRSARARMKAQWPLRKKINRADFVVRNGGTLQQTKFQIDQIWKFLLTSV